MILRCGHQEPRNRSRSQKYILKILSIWNQEVWYVARLVFAVSNCGSGSGHRRSVEPVPMGPMVFNIILGLFFMTIHGRRKLISSHLDKSATFSKNPDLPVACTPATGPCSAIFHRIIVPGAKTKLLVYSNRWFARNHVAAIFWVLFPTVHWSAIWRKI